jgi:SAM-dependent methyltransferase
MNLAENVGLETTAMSSERIDARTFWNGKILGWEKDRYAPGAQRQNVMEALAYRFSGLPQRMAAARSILCANVSGKRVVELGCGSGYLAQDMIAAGAEQYLGIDIAETAVNLAQERVEAAGLGDRIRFRAGDVGQLGTLDADIVFSLGFLDWLDFSQIDSVFRAAGSAHFFHSFSERTFSFWRYIHVIYVYLAYAHKTGTYKPAYHSFKELETIARRYSPHPVGAIRAPGMRFGCFITSLSA